MKLEQSIEEKISGIVQELGFSIEYIEFVKEGSNNILRVVIDKYNGIMDVDDCETVSRAIEDIIDSMMSKEYVLEVSSAGLERQLKNIKLYKKYVGKEIFVKLFKKNEFGKEFTGILESVNENDNTINLKYLDKVIILEIKDIANAYTTYDFSNMLKHKKDEANINQLNKF